MTYWRSRAEEARALAVDLTAPEAKRIMLDLAEGYDKLADGVGERIVANSRKGHARST